MFSWYCFLSTPLWIDIKIYLWIWESLSEVTERIPCYFLFLVYGNTVKLLLTKDAKCQCSLENIFSLSHRNCQLSFLAVPLQSSSKCRAKVGRERTGLNSKLLPPGFHGTLPMMQFIVMSIPDMTKSKDLRDLDFASGLKVLGDQAGHTDQLQNDLLFLWDYINSNKEGLAETMWKSQSKTPYFMIEVYTVFTGNGKVSKTIKNQGYYIW